MLRAPRTRAAAPPPTPPFPVPPPSGVSFLEMLAMEMKADGKYIARGLSFK